MADDRVISNVFVWETDPASAAKTIALAQSIEESQLDVSKANEVLAATAESAGVSQKSLQAAIKQQQDEVLQQQRAAAEAQKAAVKESKDIINATKERINVESRHADILSTHTVPAIESAIQSTKEQIDLYEREVKKLKELSDGSDEFTQAIKKTEAALKSQQDELKFLEGAALPAAQAGGRIDGGDDVIGKADTAAAALGGLSGALGFAGDESLMLVSDVLGTFDAFSMLKTSLVGTQAASVAAGAGGTAAAGGIGALAASLSPVLVILAPLAIAGATVAGALSFASGAYEENRKAADLAGNAIIEYNKAISEGTTEDIAQQLEDANLALEIAQKTRQDLLDAQAETWGRESSYILGDLGARIRTGLGVSAEGAEKYNQKIEEQEQAIISSQASIDGLSDALESTEVAANNAAQRNLEAIEATQQSSEAELERARFVRDASEESVKSTIEDTKLQIEALKSRREALQGLERTDATVEAIADVNREIDALGEELEFLDDVATGSVNVLGELGKTFEELSSLVEQSITDIEVAQQTELRRAKIIRDTSEEAVQQAIDDAELEIETLKKRRKALEALVQTTEVVEELDVVGQSMNSLTDELDFLSSTALDAGRANDALAEAQQQQTDAAKEAEKVAERSIDINKKVAEQRVAAQEKLADDIAKTNDKSVQDELAYRDKLLSIQVDSQKDAVKLAQDLAKNQDTLNKNLDKLAAKAQKDARDLDRDAQKDAQDANKELAKEQQSFQRDVGKIREEWRDDEKQAELDLNNSLADAVLARDVDAVIALQRSAENEKEQRSKAVQDELSEKEQERTDALINIQEESAERRAELELRRADLQEAMAQERADVIASAQERADDLQIAADEQRAARAQEQVDARLAFDQRRQERAQEIEGLQVSAAEQQAKREEAAAKNIAKLEESLNADLEIRTKGQKDISKIGKLAIKDQIETQQKSALASAEFIQAGADEKVATEEKFLRKSTELLTQQLQAQTKQYEAAMQSVNQQQTQSVQLFANNTNQFLISITNQFQAQATQLADTLGIALSRAARQTAADSGFTLA